MEPLSEKDRLTLSKHQERNDCAVRAVSIAADMDYEYVRDVFRLHGRKAGQGTARDITHRVMSFLGFDLDHKEMPELWNMANSLGLKRIPARRVCEVLDKDKVYLVGTSGHLTCVRYGTMYDWAATRRNYVNRIVEVRPKQYDNNCQ